MCNKMSENFTSVIQSIHNQGKLAEELYVIVRAMENKNNISNGTPELLVITAQQKLYTCSQCDKLHIFYIYKFSYPLTAPFVFHPL